VIDINDFVARYVAVWNEPEPAVRRKAIADLWAPDGVELTEENHYQGYEALEDRVTHAYQEFVGKGGFVFEAAGKPLSHHDAISFTTNMVAGGEIAWTGDMFVILDEDGKIRLDYQFTVT
jgi:hypothetical protein